MVRMTTEKYKLLLADLLGFEDICECGISNPYIHTHQLKSFQHPEYIYDKCVVCSHNKKKFIYVLYTGKDFRSDGGKILYYYECEGKKCNGYKLIKEDELKENEKTLEFNSLEINEFPTDKYSHPFVFKVGDIFGNKMISRDNLLVVEKITKEYIHLKEIDIL